MDKSVTAPVIQHAAVITDGEWLDTYTINSELEKSHLYKLSDLLEEMWFQIDFRQECLVCAVSIYSKRRKSLQLSYFSDKHFHPNACHYIETDHFYICCKDLKIRYYLYSQ